MEHDAEMPAETMTPVEAPDDFRTALVDVVQGYLELQEALAADDDAAALQAVTRTRTALAEVEVDLAEQAGLAWRQDSSRLDEALAAMAAAGDLAGRRAPLQTLTDAVWTTAQRFTVPFPETLRRFSCPMAYQNKGGDWIQLDPTTANPYFGAGMLLCGSQTDTLQTAARDER